MVGMFLVKLLVQVYISLIADKVELDEKGDIVSINGNPINELIQEILDGSDDVNDNFIAIKQKVTEYYTM